MLQNASFKLTLQEEYQEIFQLQQETVLGSAMVDIIILENSLLDAELVDSLQFQVQIP